MIMTPTKTHGSSIVRPQASQVKYVQLYVPVLSTLTLALTQPATATVCRQNLCSTTYLLHTYTHTHTHTCTIKVQSVLEYSWTHKLACWHVFIGMLHLLPGQSPITHLLARWRQVYDPTAFAGFFGSGSGFAGTLPPPCPVCSWTPGTGSISSSWPKIL